MLILLEVLISTFRLLLCLCLLYLGLLFISPQVTFIPGISKLSPKKDLESVHSVFPNTGWAELKTCGEFLAEQKVFNTQKKCFEEKYANFSKASFIPRCYVVPSHSRDVLTTQLKDMNFVPVISGLNILERRLEYIAIVGIYQKETKTLFLVENEDLEQVYSHEVIHYLLHEYFPETGGAGHDQSVWPSCSTPTYQISDRAKLIATIRQTF